MKIFNRVVIILILAGLFALGVFVVLNAFDFAGYQLANASNALGFSVFYASLLGFIAGLESGNLGAQDIALLVLVALIGLILFVFELKPSAPRKVRMQRGTYVTRSAVREEATAAAEQNPGVLQSNVKIKAQRRPGAKVEVRASVRQGEEVQSIQSEVQEGVRRRLAQAGIPVSNLKVRVIESDPRKTTKTRVR
jgi:uncharacterized alkaline shock family protein YloU